MKGKFSVIIHANELLTLANIIIYSKTIFDDILTPGELLVVCFMVVLTCFFETLHSISPRAIAWLLILFGALLSCLGITQWILGT